MHIQANVNADGTLKYIIPLSDYTSGFHKIGIRSKDDQGRWSHTQSHSFYVIVEAAYAITESEYYIDTDPGYGNAVKPTARIGSDSTLKFVLPLSAQTTGFHKIGFRSKDNKGVWSHTLEHAFYIDENREPVNITTLLYYFKGAGATDEIYTYNVPEPAPMVDLNFKADLSKLVGDREYEMHIWAVNAKGVRSEVLVKKIKACNGTVATARYDFVAQSNQVSFIDKSIGASKYLWDFGDKKKDTLSNPLHTYDSVGIYNVKLIITNACNVDTIAKQVSIIGLKSIFTNRGGNTGAVSVDVRGAGFVPGMQLYLHKNGEQDIFGDTLLTKDPGLITTTFNLANKAKGLWHVIAIFPDSKKENVI